MRDKAKLLLEQLEDRCTPSTLGQPWANPGHLTVSFAPDGTALNGAPSNLFSTLNRVASAAQWEQVVLKAFQTWAPQTNVNIGLVSDGGQPFGTDGAVQGDPRFGDIRIGMQALPANLVATTSPFSWTGSTWSGDVVLNSTYDFGINGQGQYDLFTVVAHEAGHALGIPVNTTDVNSIMYADYTGPRTGLDSLDIANIQAMYGARTADAFDVAHSNNTRATATAIGNQPSQLGFNADLTTAADIDYYKIVTPLNLSLATVTIQIDAAGLSCLTPTVSVYNGSGNLVTTQSASSPFSNTVTVTLPKVGPLATYYFAVSHPTSDAFSTGIYSGRVTYTYPGSILGGIIPSLIQGVVGTVDFVGNTLATATKLLSPQTADQRFSYVYQSSIGTAGDVDYYQFQAPSNLASDGSYALDAIAWQTTPGGLAPTLHLFDANGNPLKAEVMANSNSVFSFQVLGVTAGQTFYIAVAAQTSQGAGSTGGYVFGIKFNQLPETVAPPLGSNTLATASASDSGTLAMNQNGVFYFRLAAANGSSTASSNVTMTVTDQDGNVVLTLTAATGAAPRTAAVYLAAGTYTVSYRVTSTAGTYMPTTYWLSGEILSDPIGPYYTGSSPPASSSSSTMPGSTSTPTTRSTTSFQSYGASVSISTSAGTISMAIPPPGGTSTQTFTTSMGTTTVTLSTSSDGTTSLTMTTPSANSVTSTTTTSGNTSTQTLTTSDGIRVTITAPITTPAPMYSGPSSGSSQPYYY